MPKRKKIKREKIRFGQAPRNSLPAGTLETATGSDVGEGAASAAVTPGGVMAEGCRTEYGAGSGDSAFGSGGTESCNGDGCGSACAEDGKRGQDALQLAG